MLEPVTWLADAADVAEMNAVGGDRELESHVPARGRGLRPEAFRGRPGPQIFLVMLRNTRMVRAVCLT
jgi:hypothetical protein